jgi:hypothetical protein
VRTGGRVDLVLSADEGPSVGYRLELTTGEGSWRGAARVDRRDGSVALEGVDAAPPWLVEAARAFLRTAWSARRSADGPPWPRRIQRWRAAPASP